MSSPMSSPTCGAIDAASIVRFHERQLAQRDWPVLSHAPARAAPWPAIEAHHRYNGLLWRERERAGRLDLPPAEIAACRDLAARYDGKRAAARAAIDKALSPGDGLAGRAAATSGDRIGDMRGDMIGDTRGDTRGDMPGATPGDTIGDMIGDTPGATIGALVDGLSTLALRLRDVRSQAACIDAGAEHAQACATRLAHLLAQRRALAARLDARLGALRAPSPGRWECREDGPPFDAWRPASRPGTHPRQAT